RTRTEKILKSIKIDPAKIFSLNNFYAPVGLNLAAETPQEIALSILSEIQTVAKGCELGHLRDSEGAIHNRSEKVLVEEKNSPTKFCSNPTTCNDDQT
ncbi:XdhC family protein, partial [Clostridium perfringens]|uniref:XdhC family protein n=1 Tax=Clostridium perfringens TaxID=1502 RepID=UPI003753F8B2